MMSAVHDVGKNGIEIRSCRLYVSPLLSTNFLVKNHASNVQDYKVGKPRRPMSHIANLSRVLYDNEARANLYS